MLMASDVTSIHIMNLDKKQASAVIRAFELALELPNVESYMMRQEIVDITELKSLLEIKYKEFFE